MYADQLPLKLGLREAPMFANFFGENNQALVDYLQKKLLEPGERSIYVWGGYGTGKTYLLHAACYFMQEQNKNFFYLDLQDVQQSSPSILENLETYSLICIDGVEVIAGDNSWEEKLFHLYNRAIEKKSLLLFASRKPINSLEIIMPDLTSRLNWGGGISIKSINR